MENHSAWWDNHAPQLVKEEIITSETSGRIAGYFSSLKSKTPVQLILICCGILATLSISGGILAIFAHNWDDFSKPVRIFLSLVPVLAGLAVFAKALLQHAASKVWMECAAVFLVLMTGASIALVSQVYQLGGTFERFLLTWMIVALPIVYLANSSISALIYVVGITVWAYMKFIASWYFFSVGLKDPYLLYYWLLFAALIPHFIMNVKPGVYSLRGVGLGWGFGIAFLYGTNIAFLQHQAASTAIAMVMLYCIGKYYYSGAWFWLRPMQTIALGNIVVMAVLFSYEDYLRMVMEYNHYTQHPAYSMFGDPSPDELTRYSGIANLLSYLVPLAFLGIAAWLFALNHRNGKKINLAIAFYPFVVMIGLYLYFTMTQHKERATWLFTAYLLFMGAYFLYRGITANVNAVVSLGIFILSLTLFLRYIDSDISFYIKGLVYIGIGAGFLCFNYFYDKHTSGEPAEGSSAPDTID